MLIVISEVLRKTTAEERRRKMPRKIWKQLTDEEYEREKAEIEIHLELLMELL